MGPSWKGSQAKIPPVPVVLSLLVERSVKAIPGRFIIPAWFGSFEMQLCTLMKNVTNMFLLAAKLTTLGGSQREIDRVRIPVAVGANSEAFQTKLQTTWATPVTKGAVEAEASLVTLAISLQQRHVQEPYLWATAVVVAKDECLLRLLLWSSGCCVVGLSGRRALLERPMRGREVIHRDLSVQVQKVPTWFVFRVLPIAVAASEAMPALRWT